MSNSASRIEHDLLGDKAVPADAYYGVQTARAPFGDHESFQRWDRAADQPAGRGADSHRADEDVFCVPLSR